MISMGLALEADRVRRKTPHRVNQKIDAAIVSNIRSYARQGKERIDRRIRKLDGEWDIERVLETNASTLGIIGLVLGTTVNRRWLLLSGAVVGFLLLHGLEGWCPPVTLLRMAGVRTRSEIDREKVALMYTRGDFQKSPPTNTSRGPRERRRLGALVESG